MLKVLESLSDPSGPISILSGPVCAVGESLLPVGGIQLQQVELEAPLSHILRCLRSAVVESRSILPVNLHPGWIRGLKADLFFFKGLLYVFVLSEFIVDFCGEVM